MVVSSHGFIKKRSKVLEHEVQRAKHLRTKYFEEKEPLKKNKMNTYTLDQVQDKLIGKTGTPDRDKFEYELKMDLIKNAIKQARQERHLTQEELGKLLQT